MKYFAVSWAGEIHKWSWRLPLKQVCLLPYLAWIRSSDWIYVAEYSGSVWKLLKILWHRHLKTEGKFIHVSFNIRHFKVSCLVWFAFGKPLLLLSSVQLLRLKTCKLLLSHQELYWLTFFSEASETKETLKLFEGCRERRWRFVQGSCWSAACCMLKTEIVVSNIFYIKYIS